MAKAIGDLYSGSELTRLLASARLADPDGEGATKRKRLYNAVVCHQNKHLNGKATISLIVAAMTPARTLDRIPGATVTCDAINQVLSLSGSAVGADGRVHRTTVPRGDASEESRGAPPSGRGSR
jgi:hypothetical protein